MAAATIVSTSYGYRAHTGTTATAVTTGNVSLKGIVVWGNSADTVVVTDTAGLTIAKFTIATTAKSEYIPFWEARVTGLKVTLSAATVEAHFFIK